MSALYVHIPFCKQACYYCDFHFSTSPHYRLEVLGAIEEEIRLQKDFIENKVLDTIYFGGGTPSLLNVSSIDSLLNQIGKYYITSEIQEITIECNPDDIDIRKLKDYRRLGINRLSLGVQTFDDSVLTYLNRAHNSKTAISSIDMCNKAGFDNINVDLIYGISETHLAILRKDLAIIKGFDPSHISTYSLTIEPKTVFGNWYQKGKLKKMPENQGLEEYLLVQEKLTEMGFEQYEISNFSKPGYESIHNSSYWQGKPYLGVGPSAHSFNGVHRQSNIRNNAQYLKSITAGHIPAEIDHLTVKDRINERILTGLRTKWGCNLGAIEKEFNVNVIDMRKEYIRRLIENGYAALDLGILQLTKKGMLIADSICEELFL